MLIITKIFLFFLTLQHWIGFNLLHQITPGFPIFDVTDPISVSWNHLLLHLSTLWLSPGSYPYRVAISNRHNQFYIFHPMYIFPLSYSLCFHIFNSISPFINFFSLLLLLILHLSLQWISPNIFFSIRLSNTINLCMSHTMSRFHTRTSLSALSMSCKSSFLCMW
jgi:hypothetical protein